MAGERQCSCRSPSSRYRPPGGLTPKRVRRTPLTLGESPHTVRTDPRMQQVCCLPVQASSAA